jgi:hypothetical protein
MVIDEIERVCIEMWYALSDLTYEQDMEILSNKKEMAVLSSILYAACADMMQACASARQADVGQPSARLSAE